MTNKSDETEKICNCEEFVKGWNNLQKMFPIAWTNNYPLKQQWHFCPWCGGKISDEKREIYECERCHQTKGEGRICHRCWNILTAPCI